MNLVKKVIINALLCIGLGFAIQPVECPMQKIGCSSTGDCTVVYYCSNGMSARIQSKKKDAPSSVYVCPTESGYFLKKPKRCLTAMEVAEKEEKKLQESFKELGDQLKELSKQSQKDAIDKKRAEIIRNMFKEEEERERNKFIKAFDERITLVRNGIQKGTFTDYRDNSVYGYLKIGNQTWMAQDIHYKNRYLYYSIYDTDKQICPSGWHLSTIDDWRQLFEYLLGSSQEDALYERKFDYFRHTEYYAFKDEDFGFATKGHTFWAVDGKDYYVIDMEDERVGMREYKLPAYQITKQMSDTQREYYGADITHYVRCVIGADKRFPDGGRDYAPADNRVKQKTIEKQNTVEEKKKNVDVKVASVDAKKIYVAPIGVVGMHKDYGISAQKRFKSYLEKSKYRLVMGSNSDNVVFKQPQTAQNVAIKNGCSKYIIALFERLGEYAFLNVRFYTVEKTKPLWSDVYKLTNPNQLDEIVQKAVDAILSLPALR